jgi:hypothetical protein
MTEHEKCSHNALQVVPAVRDHLLWVSQESRAGEMTYSLKLIASPMLSAFGYSISSPMT